MTTHTAFLETVHIHKLWKRGGNPNAIAAEWWGDFGDVDDEFAPYKKLWMAVLLSAIKGLKPHLTPLGEIKVPYRAKVEILPWIKAEETGPGSFLWVCAALNILPGDVIEVIGDSAIE